MDRLLLWEEKWQCFNAEISSLILSCCLYSAPSLWNNNCMSICFFFLFSSKMPPSYLLLLLFYHWECEAETVFSSSLILCNTHDKQIKLTSSGDSALNWTNKTKTSLKGYCVTLVYNFNFPVKIISRKYWIF